MTFADHAAPGMTGTMPGTGLCLHQEVRQRAHRDAAARSASSQLKNVGAVDGRIKTEVEVVQGSQIVDSASHELSKFDIQEGLHVMDDELWFLVEYVQDIPPPK
jgi:hypothetical protein